MKTKILKLTDTFDDSCVKIMVKKPTLIELVKYQNKIAAVKEQEERITVTIDATLDIITKPIEGLDENGDWRQELKDNYENALAIVGFQIFRDAKVEDVGKGDEPNFTKS